MKKITVELPEGVVCAFINYVYLDMENGGFLMGARSIDSDDISAGISNLKDTERS